MRKDYVIEYKLHGESKQEPLNYGPAETMPVSEFTAYTALVMKHCGLDNGDPKRQDVYEQAEKAEITDVKVVEAVSGKIEALLNVKIRGSELIV